MDENKNCGGGSVREIARVAAKWWTDRIDGTIIDYEMSNRERSALEFFKEYNPKIAKEIEDDISHREIFVSKNAGLFDAQREKFMSLLTDEIVKDIEKKHVAYLFTTENGAEQELACVAIEAEVDYDRKNGVFPLGVEMWVTEKGIDIRRRGDNEATCIYKPAEQVEQQERKRSL